MATVLQAARPTGLYGWIKGNDALSLKLFAGFALAIQLMAAGLLMIPLAIMDEAHSPLLGPLGYLTRYAPIVLLGCVIVFAAQMFWYTRTVRRASGFAFVDDRDEPRLCAIIEPLIVARGMTPPFVGVIETGACNAFACGISRKHAVVVVTRGLLDLLTDAELEAVLAHELAHVRNGDIRLMAAANICMRLARKFKTHDEYKFNLFAAALCIGIPAFFPVILLGGLAAQVGVRLAFASRLAITSTREFIADAEAAELTRNPAALASALTRIDGRHRIEHMSRNDDAMMIAGESEGNDASHPGIGERIDALVRVTGSMVFNAPGAATREALGHPEKQALFGRRRTASVMQRARAGVPGGVLGFGRNAQYMMLATVGVFLAIHVSDLGSAPAMAAKFDVRTIKYFAGMQYLACRQPDVPACMAQQEERFRALERQRGTLLGLIGSNALAEIEGRAPNPLYGGLRPSVTTMQPYLGQSGKLTGVKAAKTSDGLFVGGEFSNSIPEKLVIAELDQVGCYQAGMAYGDPEGHYSLDQDAGDFNLAKYRRWAQDSAVGVPIEGSTSWRGQVHRYPEQRELVLQSVYDMYGLPGLTAVLSEYQTPDHARTLELLREEASDPAYITSLDALERAKLNSLLRDPDRFLPCPAVKHGA